MLNDYISSRLQIRVDDESSSIKHVNMVYCRLVDLSVFTQIMVESNLKASSQQSLDDTEKNLVFELPNALAKFYLL